MTTSSILFIVNLFKRVSFIRNAKRYIAFMGIGREESVRNVRRGIGRMNFMRHNVFSFVLASRKAYRKREEVTDTD